MDQNTNGLTQYGVEFFINQSQTLNQLIIQMVLTFDYTVYSSLKATIMMSHL